MSPVFCLSGLRLAIRHQKKMLAPFGMSHNDAWNVAQYGVGNEYARVLRKTMANKYGLFSGKITMSDVNEYLKFETLKELN